MAGEQVDGMKTIEDMAGENLAKFIEDGPRLRYDYNVWVVARDTEGRFVILGGLGALGCGEMRFAMEERYRSYPGYEEAPVRNLNWGPLP